MGAGACAGGGLGAAAGAVPQAAWQHLSKTAAVQTFQLVKFETVEGVCNRAVTNDSEHVRKALKALRIHSKPAP